MARRSCPRPAPCRTWSWPRIVADPAPDRAALARPARARVDQRVGVGCSSNVAFYFVVINVFLFIFNLLPVPPLDGWRVLLGLVPPRTAWQLRQLERQYAAIIPVIFLGFILSSAAARIIGPIVDRPRSGCSTRASERWRAGGAARSASSGAT